MDSIKMLALLLMLLLYAGCGNTLNDLNPSNSDKRPAVQPGTIGAVVGQNAPDFTLSDTLGNTVTLSSVVPLEQGVVLYFTMWCPICDTHMSQMRSNEIPNYPNVRFYAIDYVSGTVAEARNAELSNGYVGSGFTILADTQQAALGLYLATMGTTIVIDSSGVVRMNEDYKDGARLRSILAGLP